MKLSGLLDTRLICCRMKAQSKEEALGELSELLVRFDGALNRDQILGSLMEREKMGPFSMGKGVVFPHARMEAVQEFRIIIGTAPHGIDFKAPDGQAIRVVVMFIIPKKHSNVYLHAFAAFLNFFSSETHVGRIVEAPDPRGIVDYIEHSGIKFRDSTLVKEIMETAPAAVSVSGTLQEAVEAMSLTRHGCLPVVNGDQQFEGEIHCQVLLEAGIKEHLRNLANPGVLDVRGPFDDFLRLHGQTPIAALVQRKTFTVQEDDSLLEAAMKMVRWSVPMLYVLRGKKLIGVLHVHEVLKKITGARVER